MLFTGIIAPRDTGGEKGTFPSPAKLAKVTHRSVPHWGREVGGTSSLGVGNVLSRLLGSPLAPSFSGGKTRRKADGEVECCPLPRAAAWREDSRGQGLEAVPVIGRRHLAVTHHCQAQAWPPLVLQTLVSVPWEACCLLHFLQAQGLSGLSGPCDYTAVFG